MSQVSAPRYRIRAAGPQDLAAILALRGPAGPGFTSLAAGPEAIGERLANSAASYAADIREPGAQRYVLALEHLADHAVVGMAAVKARIGDLPPFFNFRVLKIAQASQATRRRFDMDVLILVNEFAGASEVGSLFVREEHRMGGIGRALAQTRYLLTAIEPQRFADRLVSELRGVVDRDGHSPFWEALGRHFFRMDFAEADRLSATTDNQFILDLMPKYPIYADLLPEAARAAIGQCHPDGVGARRLLEWEGFRYADVVDIFDAGPLMSAARDSVRTAREARRLTLRSSAEARGARRCLAATARVQGFACAPAHAAIEGGDLIAHPALGEALGVGDGAPVLVWCSDDA